MSEVSSAEKAQLNPCCKPWSEKCSKLLEGRKALRKAVQLLKEEVDKIQQDNANLKKECEEARNIAAKEGERKEKELSARMSLENEVSALKSEISSLQQRGSLDAKGRDREIGLLREQLLETNKLKELLEKEKKRADAEKKNVETEKRRAAEAQKRVKAEKDKAVEENKHADTERKKAEGYRVQLEVLKKQVEDMNSLLISEREEKARDLAVKTSLENEVSVLQSEISCLKKECADGEQKEKEYMLLKDRVSEGDEEICRLRQLLEKCIPMHINETTGLETQNASEILENANAENADAERKHGGYCENKAENCLLQLQALMKEVEETKSMLVSEKEDHRKEVARRLSLEEEIVGLKSQTYWLQQRGAEDIHGEIELLKGSLDGKEEEIRQLKELSDKVKLQLNSEKKKVDVQKKIADEACERVKAEKSKVVTESKNASYEAKKAEKFRMQLDYVKKDFLKVQSELVSEKEKFSKMKEELEVERQNVIKARQRVEAETAKADHQKKLAEVNGKMTAKERARADELSGQLELYKHKNEELQKQIQQLLHCQNIAQKIPGTLPVEKDYTKLTKMKLLKKQLKLEKMQLKHAKQVAEFEKHRNLILREELGNLRHDFVRISGRLDLLAKCFSPNDEGKADMKKDGALGEMQYLMKRRKLYDIEPHQMCTKKGSETFNPDCRAIAMTNLPKQANTLSAACVGDLCLSTSGIDSQLESFHGGSNTKLLLHSSMHASSASFSDGELVHSQDRSEFVPLSEKMVEDNSDSQPTFPYMSAEVKNLRKRRNLSVDHYDHKDRVVLDAVESVNHLFMEEKKLHLQMQEKFHFLHQILNGQKDQLEEPTNLDSIIQYGSCDKLERLHKRRKLSPEDESVLKPFHDTVEPGNKKLIERKVINELDAASPNDASVREAQACDETVKSSVRTIQGSLPNFEDIADVDYMKLLELDNSDEEEIYKKAMERPLSPTLPEISFPEALVLSDAPRNTELGSILHGEALVPDIIDRGLHCNESRGHGSKTTHEGSLHENEVLVRDVYSQSLEADKASSGWSVNCGYGLKTVCVPAIFVTSSVEDSRSIYRVFSATKACMDYCAVNTQPNSMLQRILHAVRIQEKISSMERSCVLFTLMLLNFSECKLVKTRRILYKDLIAYVDSLVRDLQPVLSTAGGRSSFEEVCSLYELLGIIDDFLINGTIVECTNSTSEMLNESNAIADVCSEDELKFSRKSATVEQMVVGSTLLSSICTSTGCIEFICETSYNLLRKSRCDTASLLTVLHVFARVVREQYFSFHDFGLTMNVVRSIVSWLERKRSLVASSPTRGSSKNNIELQFICCSTCPFGAVSIDVITSVLLEKLWGSEEPGTTCRTESTSSTNSSLLGFEHSQVEEGISRSKSIMSGTMGDTSNILSLLELVACSMGWEWTHSKVLPELLQMMERSVTSTFQIAAVLFLGEVGRVGAAASGYEDKGVQSLTCKLSSFLGRLMTEKAVFSVQIATITSLLRLLSLDFPSIMDESFKCSTNVSHSAAIDLMRDWFSRLSKDRQTASLAFLQSQIDTR